MGFVWGLFGVLSDESLHKPLYLPGTLWCPLRCDVNADGPQRPRPRAPRAGPGWETARATRGMRGRRCPTGGKEGKTGILFYQDLQLPLRIKCQEP